MPEKVDGRLPENMFFSWSRRVIDLHVLDVRRGGHEPEEAREVALERDVLDADVVVGVVDRPGCRVVELRLLRLRCRCLSASQVEV